MQKENSFRLFRQDTLMILSIVFIFSIAFAGNVFAANLVQNPHIDGSLAGWNAGVSTYDSALDATGVPGSGSANHIFVNNFNGLAGTVAISQCITNFTPGQSYNFGGKVFIPSGQQLQGTGTVLISWFTGNDCNTGFISSFNLGTSFGDPDGLWRSLDYPSAVVAPMNAQSVWFTAQHGISAQGSHEANFDDLYLSDAPAAVPTFSEWGMMVFAVIAGLGSVCYLRRQRKAES